MRILTLIKEVPDMKRVRFDRERGVVDRSSASAEINPFDVNAIQAAADLKKIIDCEVTALTMGPPKAVSSLKDAYARGADKICLMTDAAFGGSDTYATSMALAAAVKKLGEFDLIICGEKSVDGDTAQVGAEVATLLGIPHAYYVRKIAEISEAEVTVEIEELGGTMQLRKLKLPALISVTKNINVPDLPTVNRKLESLAQDVLTIKIADLEEYITKEETGFKGSKTKVAKIEIPEVSERKGVIYKGDEEKNFYESVVGLLVDRAREAVVNGSAE